MITQKRKILEALQDGDRLTPLDALERFGCFRLSARVNELNNQGHLIRSRIITRNGKHYAEYWLDA